MQPPCVHGTALWGPSQHRCVVQLYGSPNPNHDITVVQLYGPIPDTLGHLEELKLNNNELTGPGMRGGECGNVGQEAQQTWWGTVVRHPGETVQPALCSGNRLGSGGNSEAEQHATSPENTRHSPQDNNA